MSEKIPFVDRFGDAFKAATLTERNLLPARRGLRRFTSGWRLFVVVAVVLAGGGAAVAATNLLSVNSGQYVTSPGPAPGHTGELLNIGAHNALSVGMRDTRNILFAPGYSAWHRGVIQVNLAARSGQGPVGAAVMSTGDLHAPVVGASTCSWADYWVTSMRAGNGTAAATAARRIEQAPSLLSEGAIGGIQPNGLGPTIDAIKAGDVNLVRAMIDIGGLIGYGSCTALGPTGVIPAGMSRHRYHAKKAALRRAGMKLLLSDPVAVQINSDVMHSAPVETAIGKVILRAQQSFTDALVKHAPAGGAPLATRIGKELVREHPSMSGTNGADHAPGNVGLGPIRIGARLLGISTRNLPQTFAALQAASKRLRLALTIGNQVTLIDPLAGPLDSEGVSF